MTYADQMAAIGADADKAIATKSQQPATTVHHDAAADLGAKFDADLAAAKPPAPPTPVTLYGISHGDSASASVNAVGAKRLRTYNQGQLNNGKQAGVGEFWHSEKVDQRALGARNAATMTQVENLFKAVPKGRATINHERDNNVVEAGHSWTGPEAQADAAEYQRAWTVFLEIIAKINGTRDASHQLIPVPITTAQLYRSGNPAWWYVKAAPEIGVDCYVTTGFKICQDWSKANAGGKKISYGEIGCKAGGNPATDTGWADDDMLAKMNTDLGIYDAFDPPAVFWFNQGVQELTQRPKSAARWKSLCATG